jgi:hypothetical protein
MIRFLLLSVRRHALSDDAISRESIYGDRGL